MSIFKNQLFKTFGFIWFHPLNRGGRIRAVMRLFRWQFSSRLLYEAEFILPFINGTKLIVRRGMTGATGNWYSRLHEPDEMLFVLHFLRNEDLFGDIGANIGSYTVLAAGVAGCRVESFEPIPVTFDYLKRNIAINNLTENVGLHCLGLSDKVGELIFTDSLDTVNHIVSDNNVGLNVRVDRLDAFFVDNCPALIKIDVEGFEVPVLNGAKSILNDNRLKAVIVETNGSGNRYGFTDTDIFDILSKYGFVPCHYDGIQNKLSTYKEGQLNTIFVKDIHYVKSRLEASKFNIQ